MRNNVENMVMLYNKHLHYGVLTRCESGVIRLYDKKINELVLTLQKASELSDRKPITLDFNVLQMHIVQSSLETKCITEDTMKDFTKEILDSINKDLHYGVLVINKDGHVQLFNKRINALVMNFFNCRDVSWRNPAILDYYVLESLHMDIPCYSDS